MLNLTYEKLYTLIVRTLNRIDDRLNDHNERVTYRVFSACKKFGTFDDRELCEIIWTILFHDVGNFKHVEVKNLIERENVKASEHAKYGYAFLKEFSPFGKYADVVLYHHSSHEVISKNISDEKTLFVSDVLAVADTVDLLKINKPTITKEEIQTLFCRLSGKKYSCEAVEIIVENESTMPNQTQIRKELTVQLSKVRIAENESNALLNLLVASIDFRSRFTALHCAIIVSVADILSALCNLSEKDRLDIHLGAVLHDLGKISTPLSILEGTTKLNDDEWVIMRNHVVQTEKILDGVICEKVKRIACRHHETLDGLGYPYKIKGEKLTIPQRIVAVADVISALAQERSYKKAFTLEDIMTILFKMVENGKLDKRIMQTVEKNKEYIYNNVKITTEKVKAQYERVSTAYNGLVMRVTT